ncbi:MAG: thioesterase [Sphingobacteriia bacterium]|jgi:fluoroacetyl-CoA thioesterase|nr:thioesterase family protein [Paludibacteraceae bacterium]NCA79992.1 thioesterase [Sphingobacteriia bacterium]
MGSGEADVLATPAMVALMEKTAYMSVNAQLEQGQTTVGTMITIEHLSATPVGMDVFCESKLINIDGKRLTFEVKAFDKSGCIGEGTHERFIVNSERFQLKANEKLSQ